MCTLHSRAMAFYELFIPQLPRWLCYVICEYKPQISRDPTFLSRARDSIKTVAVNRRGRHTKGDYEIAFRKGKGHSFLSFCCDRRPSCSPWFVTSLTLSKSDVLQVRPPTCLSDDPPSGHARLDSTHGGYKSDLGR